MSASSSYPERLDSKAYVTSRGDIPLEEGRECSERSWFNMWKRRLWPYRELQVGDTLFWYNAKSKMIVKKTTVTKVDRFEYDNKVVARQQLIKGFNDDPVSDPYFQDAAAQGYCLAFRVKHLEHLSLPIPNHFKFPRDGWLDGSNKNAQSWLSQTEIKLTRFQERILRVLYRSSDWMTRKDIGSEIRRCLGVSKGYEKGYAKAMRAPRVGISPNSLEGRGFVRRLELDSTSGIFEYKITTLGRVTVKSLGFENDLEWRLSELSFELDVERKIDPKRPEEELDRVLREILPRRGQREFRKDLIEAYKCCAVTGANAEAALEAAHITPYSVSMSNEISNGLLLRSDIHTLFDLNLIGIDPDSLRVCVAKEILKTCYKEYDGRILLMPTNKHKIPSKDALKKRWLKFNSKTALAVQE